MVTYSWQFDALDVYLTYQTVNNAVYSMHWRRNADDGSGHTATSYGVQPCGPIDPNNFTPFNNLTLNQVVGWLEAQISAEDLAGIDADLLRIINEKAAPTTAGLAPPW